LDLKDIIAAKEEEYQDFKRRNGFEDAMGFQWNDDSSREEGLAMRNSVRELKAKLANMA